MAGVASCERNIGANTGLLLRYVDHHNNAHDRAEWRKLGTHTADEAFAVLSQSWLSRAAPPSA